MIPSIKWFLSVAVLILAGGQNGVCPAADDGSVDYLRDIKPILKERCYACHGSLKQSSGLRLDSGELIRKGGDAGEVVVPSNTEESFLLERLVATELSERMPPEGEPLTAEQIELIRRWISQGAKSPENEKPEADPREHWSFRPVARPPLPASVAGTAKNPIDLFLARTLADRGLKPQPAASKSLWLRRVYFDLIGLPPTTAELRAFLADDVPTAKETVVNRLLEDPRHGERWARHWMDIWRYSDWYGRRDANDVRNSAGQMFRWRDWIVQSLNQGKTYDRMVSEMIAGDELYPEDDAAGIATAYLVRNYYSLNPNDWMRSTVEHTGKAFLGLTFNCAHCHDHKYDPIEHDDYFRMRAFFEPVYIRQDRVPGEPDPGPFQDYVYGGSRRLQRLGVVRIFDKSPEAPTWFYTGGDERNRVEDRGSISPGIPRFLESAPLEIETVNLPPRAWYPGLRPAIQEAVLAEAAAGVSRAEAALEAARKSTQPVPEALTQQIAVLEQQYGKAIQSAQSANQPGALGGRQSLLMDATEGRRILQNPLKQITNLGEGSVLSFQLLILKDAHINFQFVKNRDQSLTAGYLGFVNGHVKAYQPGTTSEFEVGTYDFPAGENRFDVSFLLQPSMDRALVTIRLGAEKKLVAESIPVAINGWNPVNNPQQPITLDARTGSVAVLDDFVWIAPPEKSAEENGAENAQSPVFHFDFELPKYRDGLDAVGIDDWVVSPHSAGTAISVVSTTAGNLELRDLAKKVATAKREVRALTLPLLAAETHLVASRVEQESVQARVAADKAKYGETSDADVSALARVASLREREATARQAEASVLDQEIALATAEANDANRGKEIEAATKGLANARTSLQQAQAALEKESLAETYSPFSPVYPKQSTGRRTALAKWMTSRDNPLTARVAVNHIWGHHFHVPLVESVYNFGRNGDRPSHPELLDWLAVEFMESGWDMKHLHRQIVMSDAYARISSSNGAEGNVALDPENTFLWRMNSSRMEAEVVRDSLLSCGGQLETQMGGVELENNVALTTNRRSLYYSVYPEKGGTNPLGELFDAPNPLDCYRRTQSIVPQQALALTNSELVHRMAEAIVKDWSQARKEEGTAESEDLQFVQEMFERILSRSPTEAEQKICQAALARQRELQMEKGSSTPAAVKTEALESLVRVLLNHNDFVTIR